MNPAPVKPKITRTPYRVKPSKYTSPSQGLDKARRLRQIAKGQLTKSNGLLE